MSDNKYYLPWNDDSLIWGSNPYVWSEVFVVIHVAQAVGGGGGGLILDPKNPWKDVLDQLREKKVPDKTAKNFLRVVAKVNGITTESRKPLSEIEKKIQVKHIRKTFETFNQKVEVKVKNIRN